MECLGGSEFGAILFQEFSVSHHQIILCYNQSIFTKELYIDYFIDCDVDPTGPTDVYQAKGFINIKNNELYPTHLYHFSNRIIAVCRKCDCQTSYIKEQIIENMQQLIIKANKLLAFI